MILNDILRPVDAAAKTCLRNETHDVTHHGLCVIKVVVISGMTLANLEIQCWIKRLIAK